MHAEWLRKVGCCLTHQIWNISEGGLGINGTSVSVFILFVVRPVLYANVKVTLYIYSVLLQILLTRVFEKAIPKTIKPK